MSEFPDYAPMMKRTKVQLISLAHLNDNLRKDALVCAQSAAAETGKVKAELDRVRAMYRDLEVISDKFRERAEKAEYALGVANAQVVWWHARYEALRQKVGALLK